MSARSSRPGVRNPIVELEAAQELAAFLRENPELQVLFIRLMYQIGRVAGERGQELWDKHKAPMAAYWKAKAVDARHIARAVK